MNKWPVLLLEKDQQRGRLAAVCGSEVEKGLSREVAESAANIKLRR